MNIKPLRTWLLGRTLNLQSSKMPKKILLAAFITFIATAAKTPRNDEETACAKERLSSPDLIMLSNRSF